MGKDQNGPGMKEAGWPPSPAGMTVPHMHPGGPSRLDFPSFSPTEISPFTDKNKYSLNPVFPVL